MSVIAKRFLDGGLKDLVIEAEILPKGSTVSSLSSPHYNKAIRVHKYVYESLMRCKIRSFEKWLMERQGEQHPLFKFKESAEMHEMLCKPDFQNFSRYIVLQQKRNISIREVLKFELGPLPLSIACCDGGMVKSTKAKLGNELKKVTPEVSNIPEDSSTVTMAWSCCRRYQKVVRRLEQFLTIYCTNSWPQLAKV